MKSKDKYQPFEISKYYNDKITRFLLNITYNFETKLIGS